MQYPYDPAKAKQLLAEAGYPNGFDTELVSYVLPQWEGAVQNYLRPCGINAHVTHLQVAAEVQRSLAGQNPLELASGAATRSTTSRRSCRISSPAAATTTRVIRRSGKLVEAGGATVDPDQRRKSYSEAIKLITRTLMGADVHLRGDLWLLEAAQLQAVCGRATAVLPRQLEVVALCVAWA